MANETETAHVPAWKKLGLKLKYAKEAPEQRNEDYARREKSEDAGLAEEPVNKADKEDKKEKKKKRRLEETEDSKVDSAAADEGSSKKKKKQKKEKKVSFSAETKVEDGSGDEGAEEKTESEGAVSNEDNGDAQTEEKPGAEEKRKRMKEKKEKKKQQEAQAQAPPPNPSNIHETLILQYLNLYHQNRPAWKFQKNRETQLFKHILEPERVPTEYNAAILSYLQGLKGEAARQRLSQSGEEIIKAEMEEQIAKENTEEVPEGESAPDMTDYYKAVEAFRKRLSLGNDDLNNVEVLDGQQNLSGDLRKRLEKRLRAEVITFTINGKLVYVQRPKPSKRGQQQTGGQAQAPAQKKKKNRTAVIDISSSESDSDSDDDKPSQKSKLAEKQSEAPAKKKKSRTAAVDISTSSESDSDSSSDSESDNDSDSGNKKTTKTKRDDDSDGFSSSSSDSDSDGSSSSDSD